MASARPSLPGAHRVTKRLSQGRFAIYWYAYRGGQLLLKFEGDNEAAAKDAERRGAHSLAAAYAVSRSRPPPEKLHVRDLVTLYKAAPDGFLKLREGKKSTRAKWSPFLDRIVRDFGDLGVAALKAKGIRRELIDWRNGWAATPRTADYAMTVMKRLLSWSLDHELIEANPAATIKGLYSKNRADVIVEPEELAAVVAETSAAAGLAFRLAAATGMRRGDLVDLRWTEVEPFSIRRAANKSTTGRRLTVPLTQDAREILEDLRARRSNSPVASTYVLTSRIGPWTEDGLTSNWVKAAKKAKVAKRLNDLRGTAATNFCRVPLTDEEVADIMAWEPERVRDIRKRYVDPEKIAQGIVERMERADALKKGHAEGA